jgi:type I restriction enzyme S subunit
MTRATEAFPNAFAVRFKDLDRWDPASFQPIAWHWPTEIMVPVGSVLLPRRQPVDRMRFAFSDLQPVTIHFDGSIERRDVNGIREYKMDLFFACPGDIIVAKIDLKNGALAIVPDGWKNVVVTSHFAVYEPNRLRLLPEYLRRLIQTSFFKAHLWRNKVGAEGRKEVKLSLFESFAIPLPPLRIQRAIVRRWEDAQGEILKARERVKCLDVEIPGMILTELEIPLRAETALPKVFALWWKNLERWSVSYMAPMATGAGDIHRTKYPLKRLGEIAQVAYGIAKSPANRPGRKARPYLRVANVQRGELNLSEIKFIDVPDSELNAVRLQRGDLLVCEGNSADLVGRPAIWNDEIPDCVHQNHILRVRVNSTFALPEFILEYMQTPPARNYFRARAKFTTNLASINSADLRELEVPLPPLSVQREILRSVTEARREIVREREKACKLGATVEQEIEEMMLGVRPIPVVEGESAGRT